MMIKLFASDMDGTLLDETHTINDRTAKAIHDLQAAGVEFMIATGRDYQSASRLTKAQNISCAMINLNGSLVHDKDGNVIYDCPLEQETIESVITYLINHDLLYTIYTEAYTYFYNRDEYIQNTFKNLQKRFNFDDLTAAQIKDNLMENKDASEFTFSKENPVLKMMIMSENDDKLHHTRHYLEKFPELDVTSSGPGNLEITHKDAQKGLAIIKYIEKQGYTMDNVVTIGDSLNDRSMLQLCPNSYAMANASDEIKKMAAHTTFSNDQYGVAVVIEELLENMKK